MPEWLFRQEFLAEFLDEAGGVFRNVGPSIDRKRDRPSLVMQPGLNYSMGLDLARVEDFTVITIIDSQGRQVYFERFNQISWERQIAAIVHAARTLRPVVYCDSTGVGDPIYERLAKPDWTSTRTSSPTPANSASSTTWRCSSNRINCG